MIHHVECEVLNIQTLHVIPQVKGCVSMHPATLSKAKETTRALKSDYLNEAR